jgi:glycosyltransferase involved in cell wall biosynthesis
MISVVTPCLNVVSNGREGFFRKMMDGIHLQTYGDIEHIVVDGGSADGTKEILDEYLAKGWITALLHEGRTGIYPAMNAGLRAVRGDYVNIMNTDDYFLDRGYFQEALGILEKGEFDFVHADRVIRSRIGQPDSVKKGDERVAYFRMPFRHQTMLVKKNIFDEVGLFDETYEICADYAWVLKVLAAGKKGFHLQKTVLCSLGGGASSDRRKCVEEVARILHEAYGREAGLSLGDCRDIYLWKISGALLAKIEANVKDVGIIKSLRRCHDLGDPNLA